MQKEPKILNKNNSKNKFKIFKPDHTSFLKIYSHNKDSYKNKL